jgi:hypothetical protein
MLRKESVTKKKIFARLALKPEANPKNLNKIMQKLSSLQKINITAALYKSHYKSHYKSRI